MSLGRLFRGSSGASRAAADGSAEADANDADTAALRRIVAQLQELQPEQRKYVAGFAYVLGRIASADMTISPKEVQLMEQTVVEVAGLPEAQAVLVVQIALNHAALYGGTDDYVITREFAQMATREQLERLLRCAFLIGAADETINAQESAELDEIGRELGFDDPEIRRMRAEFSESFSAVQELRRLTRSSRGSTPA